jgi:hypothetical protein
MFARNIRKHRALRSIAGTVFVAGLGAGAALMYFLDPESGRGRRARVGEKGIHARTLAGHFAGRNARHWRNRLTGLRARLMRGGEAHDTDDLTVRDRIRSELGRVLRHASSIDVTVIDGLAILSGHVHAEEAEALLGLVRGVEGVQGVKSRLSVKDYRRTAV